jgi:hypothetical protein
MPKRVHSASERDDNDESSNTSKRTRKATELVGEFNLPHRLHFFLSLQNNLCQEFYDGLRSYKSDDGRSLCENFLRLPSKRYFLLFLNLLK